jgi:DNA-binding Xre family transcriptional regulator
MLISNVKKIMEDKGITIRAMVVKTGISDKTILRARCSRINECRVYTLEAIAKSLDCKVKDLFDET